MIHKILLFRFWALYPNLYSVFYNIMIVIDPNMAIYDSRMAQV